MKKQDAAAFAHTRREHDKAKYKSLRRSTDNKTNTKSETLIICAEARSVRNKRKKRLSGISLIAQHHGSFEHSENKLEQATLVSCKFSRETFQVDQVEKSIKCRMAEAEGERVDNQMSGVLHQHEVLQADTVDWPEIAYAIGVYVTGATIVFGIIGNVLSCWILVQSGRRTSMYCIMEALCVSDTIMLLANLAFQILPNLKDRYEQFYSFYHIYGLLAIVSWPISFAAQMTTVWLTVLISVERWFAVCQPLLTSKYCSYKRTRLTCYCVFVFSLLYCSPRFFEYTLCMRWSPDYYEQLGNETTTEETHGVPYCSHKENGTGYSLQKNAAIGTTYLVVYCAILYFLIAFLLPILLISVLNTKLILELHRCKEMWSQLSRNQKKEQKITKLPICIVVLFLVCGAPALAVNVLDAAQIHLGSHWDLMITIGNLLIMVNSATNFIIYCLVGKDFRNALIHLFVRKKNARDVSISYALHNAAMSVASATSPDDNLVRRNSNSRKKSNPPILDANFKVKLRTNGSAATAVGHKSSDKEAKLSSR